jgi:hypothetical protein
LTNQRNKRDEAGEVAEKSEGKYEEQKRRGVNIWRRKCAIMKKNKLAYSRKKNRWPQSI